MTNSFGLFILFCYFTKVYSCDGFLSNRSGIISAPEVSSERLDCWWLLQTEPNNKIDYQVLDFYLNSESWKCTKATIEIWDHMKKANTLCGNIDRPMLTQRTDSHFLRINFRCDPGHAATFRISYSVVEIQVKQCGGVITATRGWIRSPDDDLDGNYDHNLNCWWNITAPRQNVIEFKFSSLQIQGYIRCYKDIVEVYDNDDRIFWYCDGYTKIPIRNRTLSNVLRVHFLSDDASNDKGFTMIYTIIGAGTEDPGDTDPPSTSTVLENSNQVSTEDNDATLKSTTPDGASGSGQSFSISPVVLLILHLLVVVTDDLNVSEET